MFACSTVNSTSLPCWTGRSFLWFVILNNAIMIIIVHMSLLLCVIYPRGKFLEMELLSWRVEFWNFRSWCQSYLIYISLKSIWECLFPGPAFCLRRLSHVYWSFRWKMEFWNLGLHFFNYVWIWASFQCVYWPFVLLFLWTMGFFLN